MDIQITRDNTEENKLDIYWDSTNPTFDFTMETGSNDCWIVLQTFIEDIKKANKINFINGKSLNDILLTISEGKFVTTEYPDTNLCE